MERQFFPPSPMKFPAKRHSIFALLLLLILVGALGYGLEFSFPLRSPQLNSTLTALSQFTPQEIGSYDVLGVTISRAEAEQLSQTESGQAQLKPEIGAVEITSDLIELGRDAFYRETFGNEYFFTDVMGVINGPINLVSVGKAIAALKGQPTTDLQIPLDQAVTIGGQTFPAGALLHTGLDVPPGALAPLGMQLVKSGAKLRVGLTCALCHAALDQSSGKIIEGAPNSDLDTGLLQAFATNSAAMFRQTGANPLRVPQGDRVYVDASGRRSHLPDADALEAEVDEQFLAWPPGNFDSTGDNQNNPSQTPSSYTFNTYPYGWNGFSSIGWFHGLTTLNNNVHATNSDPTTGASSSQDLLGIDRETYLGVILQNAADPKFRVPQNVKPSEFFETVDPTPGTPAINQVIKAPGFPKGSMFIADGLMASSPGLPAGTQLNAMSAYQNTLSPPPVEIADTTTLRRGAALFDQANCTSCHVGRYFTNHHVIAETELHSQPSRAIALAKFPRIFIAPQAYPSNVPVPLPVNPPVLPVPMEVTAQEDRDLAYAISNPAGGYKVQNLIGLDYTAPYLHDGGVAASAAALQPNSDGSYQIAKPEEMGLAGTWMRRIEPDPAASLRVLVDRSLRQEAIAQNRANRSLQLTNSDGSGHEYWVDQQAGFTPQDQTDLIQFLLSIDDDPAAIPSQ